MTLDELPVELIHRVCVFSEPRDIRSLRLTSRLLSTVANDYFLPHIAFFFAEDDLQAADAVVSTPSVANGVRSLHFQADRQVPLLKYEAWHGLMKASARLTAKALPDNVPAIETPREKRCRLRDQRRIQTQYTKQQLQDAFKAYQELDETGRDMIDTSRPQRTMLHLFQSCPKLDSVAVTMKPGYTLAKAQLPEWHKVPSFRASMVPPWGDALTCSFNTVPANEALRAAHLAGRKLKRLELAPISFQFFKQEDGIMQEMYSILDKLESVSIIINDDFCSDREPGPNDEDDAIGDFFKTQRAARRILNSLRDGRIANFLNNSSALREMSIDPPLPPADAVPLVRLEDIVGSGYWPHLSTLSLCQFQCEGHQLVNFVMRHRHSLEHLELACVILIPSDTASEDWPAVFTKIAGKLPRLHTVLLEGFLENPDGTMTMVQDHDDARCVEYVARLERYVLDGNGACPVLSG